MTTPARAIAAASTFVVLFVASATAAVADAPASPDWPTEPGRSHLDNGLVFVGGTVALFVVIWLFGLLTARNNYVPPAPGTELEKAGSHDVEAADTQH